MKKMLAQLVVVLALVPALASAASTWTRQATQSHKLGFGAVVGEDATGSIALSSCDGAATVTGERSCQIGTGTLESDDTLQYRDKVIVGPDGELGPVVYGNMLSKYYTWVEDWSEAGYVAGAAVTNVAGAAVPGSKFSETENRGSWHVTVVDGGTDNAEVIKIADDAVNGVLVITANNATNDGVSVQLNGEMVKLAADYDVAFRARWATEDVDKQTNFVGLCLAGTTSPCTALGTDYIGFRNDGAGNLYFVMAKNSAAVSLDTGVDLTNNTYVRTGFGWYDNVLTVTVDGEEITSYASTVTNVPNDEVLSPVMAIKMADTGADDMLVDYIGFIQERQ